MRETDAQESTGDLESTSNGILIGGRAIAFREPNSITSPFEEGLAPFVSDLVSEIDDDNQIGWRQMARLIYRHRVAVFAFMGECAACNQDWLSQLSPEDGELFFSKFWETYHEFFKVKVFSLKAAQEASKDPLRRLN